MDFGKNIFSDFCLLLGCFSVGFLTVVSTPILYRYSKNILDTVIDSALGVLLLNWTDTPENEYTLEQNNFVEVNFIPNLIDLDVSSTPNVISFINIYFIKELILLSQKNVSHCYNHVVSNECFYYLIKKVFSIEENRISCLNSITEPFRKIQMEFFFEDLIKSKNINYFKSLKRNIYPIQVVLDFLIHKYKLK